MTDGGANELAFVPKDNLDVVFPLVDLPRNLYLHSSQVVCSMRTEAQRTGEKVTHLLKHEPHIFHAGVVGSYLAVDVQRALQDLAHLLRVDNGVMLRQVSVQFLNLVLQALDFYLEGL